MDGIFEMLTDSILENGCYLSDDLVRADEARLHRNAVEAMLSPDGWYRSNVEHSVLYVGPPVALTQGPAYAYNALGAWHYRVLWLQDESEWLGWHVRFELATEWVRVSNPETPDYRAEAPHDVDDPEPCRCADAQMEEQRIGDGGAVTTGYIWWCQRHDRRWFTATPVLANILQPGAATIVAALAYQARAAGAG